MTQNVDNGHPHVIIYVVHGLQQCKIANGNERVFVFSPSYAILCRRWLAPRHRLSLRFFPIPTDCRHFLLAVLT